MTHELGHTLGLRHTDWFSRQSCGYYQSEPVNPADLPNAHGTNHIPGTPEGFDPNSIMLSCFNSSVIGEFGGYDIVALNYLYPAPPQLSGAYLICGGSQTYTLAGGTATSWLKSSNLQIVSSTATSIIVQPINSSTNGAGYIDAVTSSGTIRYNVWVNRFTQSVTLGTNAVCTSQAYYYTCTVPGGHKPGYTYRWTMPNSTWYIHGSSSGPTIFAGPSGSNGNPTGQMLVEVNTGCGGWSLVGGLITYPSYSCP